MYDIIFCDQHRNFVMGKLTKKERDALPDNAFALPGRRFPIIDKRHARAALSRAAEGLEKGWITKEQFKIVERKAKEVLGKD